MKKQIQQLGFFDDVNVNEMAAKGFKLSIRDIISEKLLKKQSSKVINEPVIAEDSKDK